MGNYVSIGQFNKNYLFIIGAISFRIIVEFITGFTPYLTPNDSFYLFGFKSNFVSRPFVKSCFEYFSIAIGGLILRYFYNKKIEDRTSSKDINFDFSSNKLSISEISSSSVLLFNDINKKNYEIYKKKIFFIFFAYYFAKISMSSLDKLGYNRVKFWPLEFIFLYIFSKKLLGKTIYKHQFLSISLIIIFCTTIYLINSFFPYSNKNCSELKEEEREECDLLSKNIYNDISNKLGWTFVPGIILIYLIAMICNAYSSIKNKWFMDFKYISTYNIMIFLGIIGLIFSIILLIGASFISCSQEKINIKYICEIKYKNSLYYDNFRDLKNIEINGNFFLDIFIVIPIFLISSFLIAYFELLIIKKLDPFYLIPIDCAYFLIYEIIDFCLTVNKSNLYRNIKFCFQVTSNTVSVLLCCVYLEIFELHFFDLDKYIRKNIIKRERRENLSLQIFINEDKERNEKEEVENMNEIEATKNDILKTNSNSICVEGYNLKI